MKHEFRVAMRGAATLLGKEILTVLNERGFPTSGVTEIGPGSEMSDAVTLDLESEALPVFESDSGPFDLIFLAGAVPAGARASDWAQSAGEHAPLVIDATGDEQEPENSLVYVPLLDNSSLSAAVQGGTRFFVSPHPAAIVLGGMINALARRLKLERIVAQIYHPASEFGPAAIEELQKQTVNLLSFKKMPREIFDAQLAFNLVPRLGRKSRAGFARQEARIRSELRRILNGRAPVPSLRLIQAPVFYSLALSIYVQAEAPVKTAQIEEALAGDNFRVLRSSQASPSPPEVQGSATVIIDPVAMDPDHSGGFWLWAIADNLRLAAHNAVEIGEKLLPFMGAS